MNWNEISKFKISFYGSIVCPEIYRMQCLENKLNSIHDIFIVLYRLCYLQSFQGKCYLKYKHRPFLLLLLRIANSSRV